MLVGLRVEVDELHAAGTAMAQSVAAPITLAAGTVAPAAGDQVSATVAAGVSARLQAIGAHSVRAAHITSSAAGVLHANAVTYREQEELNAASLRPGGASAGPVAASTAGMTAAVMPPTAVPSIPASPPTGVVPSDGKSVAVLIHGGAGPEPLLAAARAARAHATELRAISTDLRAASDRLGRTWLSPAAETATGRIATLASWYDNHAQHAATTARACEAHADSFTQARAAIPRPEVFDDLERRLQAASRANAANGGLYTPVVAALQTQLGATHTQALTAYADYTTRAAADLGGDTPTPAPPTVQAVGNHTIKQSPPDDPDPNPKPPVEGLPPEGLRPPVEGPLDEGPASRPSARDRGGRSLYDQHGGEWRYYPGDERHHNPHWDYKPRPGPGSKWDNIPIDDAPPLKGAPENPSIISGLPPWLLNPAAAPPGVVGPPQNPLLAPFPGTTMPAPPPIAAPAPGPSLIPHISAPHIDPPPPAAVGGGAALTGMAALLARLLIIFDQG